MYVPLSLYIYIHDATLRGASRQAWHRLLSDSSNGEPRLARLFKHITSNTDSIINNSIVFVTS